MPSVYDKDAFAARVNYAAACIVIGGSRIGTRHFDTCFEMWDGDLVAVALVRRAKKNPKLAEALPRAINIETAEAAAARYANVPTRNLADEARKVREQCEARSEADAARRAAQHDAEVAAASRNLAALGLAWLGYVTIQTDTRIVCGIYRIVADPHPDFPGAVAVQSHAGEIFPLDRKLASDIADVVPTSIAMGDRYPDGRAAIPKGAQS